MIKQCPKHLGVSAYDARGKLLTMIEVRHSLRHIVNNNHNLNDELRVCMGDAFGIVIAVACIAYTFVENNNLMMSCGVKYHPRLACMLTAEEVQAAKMHKNSSFVFSLYSYNIQCKILQCLDLLLMTFMTWLWFFTSRSVHCVHPFQWHYRVRLDQDDDDDDVYI